MTFAVESKMCTPPPHTHTHTHTHTHNHTLIWTYGQMRRGGCENVANDKQRQTFVSEASSLYDLDSLSAISYCHWECWSRKYQYVFLFMRVKGHQEAAGALVNTHHKWCAVDRGVTGSSRGETFWKKQGTWKGPERSRVLRTPRTALSHSQPSLKPASTNH